MAENVCSDGDVAVVLPVWDQSSGTVITSTVLNDEKMDDARTIRVDVLEVSTPPCSLP